MLDKLTLFRSTITMVVGVTAALSIFLAGTAYWFANKSHYLIERSSVAHAVHAEYLQLSVETYRLFKQLVEVLISEYEAVSVQTRNHAIHDNLHRLRELHAIEVTQAQGDDELVGRDELDLLARIEDQIEKVLAELQRASILRATGRSNEAQKGLVQALERSIDIEFAALVGEALQRERAQVYNAETIADDLTQRYSRVMEASALMILAVSGVFVLAARNRLWQPLARLSAATQRLKQGDLGYRVHIPGNDEFAAIGAEFNAMAGQLLLQRQKLEADKHDLEKTVRDKTEDLRLANERLQKTDQHRRQFFADISHELRTPLTLIKGEGQIALRGSEKNTGEYQEALRRISEQADQLTRLVDELLFIARTGDGAVHMKVAPVSLDKLLERVVEDASLVARDENLRIRFESHTTRLWLLGDKDKLKQLFMILVMNAIRYSNPNGRITMSLAEGRDTAIVKVMDEGMGIPEADIHGIFERFYRGSNVKFANIEGSGLGLPFAQAIVLAHNGSIDVESELGKGTTLIVSLPATRKLHSVA